jgi:hypothetical protein
MLPRITHHANVTHHDPNSQHRPPLPSRANLHPIPRRYHLRHISMLLQGPRHEWTVLFYMGTYQTITIHPHAIMYGNGYEYI